MHAICQRFNPDFCQCTHPCFDSARGTIGILPTTFKVRACGPMKGRAQARYEKLLGVAHGQDLSSHAQDCRGQGTSRSPHNFTLATPRSEALVESHVLPWSALSRRVPYSGQKWRRASRRAVYLPSLARIGKSFAYRKISCDRMDAAVSGLAKCMTERPFLNSF